MEVDFPQTSLLVAFDVDRGAKRDHGQVLRGTQSSAPALIRAAAECHPPREAGLAWCQMAFDPGTAERIRNLLTGQRGVVEKRMFGGIAFMVHGHMCVGISGGDLMVRVGATGHAEALAQPHARPMDFTGRPMKGFVFVSPAGYESDAALRSWLDRGLRHARSLPPK